MLEKINCNSILFIGEDIINIIHEYVHWNTTMKIWSKRKIVVQLRIYCVPVTLGIYDQWWMYCSCHWNNEEILK